MSYKAQLNHPRKEADVMNGLIHATPGSVQRDLSKKTASSVAQSKLMTRSLEMEIERLARALWERRGRPQEATEQDRKEAERLILMRWNGS